MRTIWDAYIHGVGRIVTSCVLKVIVGVLNAVFKWLRLTSLVEGDWLACCPSAAPQEMKSPVPIVLDAKWTPEPVWTP
jgi:hypothetical protein